jgi:hypothetical protein
MGKENEKTKRIEARNQLADRLGFLLAKHWLRRNKKGNRAESGRERGEAMEVDK